jgi:hypothetical protein
VSRSKGKKVMRITKFAGRPDGRPMEILFQSKISFLSTKRSNSSRTSIKKFGFSVHKINTFITIVNRKYKPNL